MSNTSQPDDISLSLPGWIEITHKAYDVPCYMHTATRVIAWTRPYHIAEPFGGGAEDHRPPKAALGRKGFLDAQARQLLNEWDHIHAAQQRELEANASSEAARAAAAAAATGDGDGNSSTSNAAELERELSTPPPLRYEDFREHCEGPEMQGRPSNLNNVPLRFLTKYARSVLGATVVMDLRLATDGQWAQPPYACSVDLLGVRVTEALHSSKDYCRALAAEDALMVLCPMLYAEELRRNGLRGPRHLRHSITDEAELDTLALDDERILDIDLCLGRTPPMLVHEYAARHFGQTLPCMISLRRPCFRIGTYYW